MPISLKMLGLMIALQSASAIRSAERVAESPAASISQNQNWPQWRGPQGTGAAAPSANPPTVWSEEKNIKWKVAIPGSGSATPVIWGDKIFVQTAIPTGKKPEAPPAEKDAAVDTKGDRPGSDPPAQNRPNADRPAGDRKGPPGGKGGGFGMQSAKPTEIYQFVILCLNRQNGKEIWRRVAREEVPHEGVFVGNGSFAAASPVTDGRHIYAFFGSRGLYCYDMDGNLKWEKDLGKMKIKLTFGEGSSPALFGNTLVVNWDQEGGNSFIVAFNAQTGEELWRTPRDEDTSWTTPLFVERDGQTQIVSAATKKIRSYDPATGKLLWECAGLTTNSIPSPVAGNGLVYATTGFRGSIMLAIKLGRRGDLTESDAIAWKFEKDTPYTPSPLLYNGKLYFLKVNDAIVTCLNATNGEALFGPKRLEVVQNVYASPVGAAGRVYIAGRNGVTAVLAGGDTFEVLATNTLDDGFDASPVVVGKELFLRGKNLYCIAEK
jgi:outer membrane protein assembly factor BamB